DRQRSRAVSIHAPARGATDNCGAGAAEGRGFNPRARTGRDTAMPFAPPHHSGFNPRARTGRDEFAEALGFDSYEFQSTRPHGARRAAKRNQKIWGEVSIHAPARGATAGTSNPLYIRVRRAKCANLPVQRKN